jgi:hypothetical protein
MLEVLPPEAMKEIVIATGADAGMPGCGEKSLYDAKPQIRELIDRLYLNGYALCVLIDSEKSKVIASQLSEGKKVNIK